MAHQHPPVRIDRDEGGVTARHAGRQCPQVELGLPRLQGHVIAARQTPLALCQPVGGDGRTVKVPMQVPGTVDRVHPIDLAHRINGVEQPACGLGLLRQPVNQGFGRRLTTGAFLLQPAGQQTRPQTRLVGGHHQVAPGQIGMGRGQQFRNPLTDHRQLNALGPAHHPQRVARSVAEHAVEHLARLTGDQVGGQEITEHLVAPTVAGLQQFATQAEMVAHPGLHPRRPGAHFIQGAGPARRRCECPVFQRCLVRRPEQVHQQRRQQQGAPQRQHQGICAAGRQGLHAQKRK